MALAAGLHGCVRFNFSKAGKVDQFGANFKVRILVDSDVIRPFRKISGKIVVESRFPIKQRGVLIQFEGLCTLRYSTKLDNRTTFHQGRQCILENTKSDVDGYQESPVQQVIQDDPGCDAAPYVINPGVVTYFPFILIIPGNPHLPAPFKNSLGNLVYRLVVYMKSTNGIQVEIGELLMRFEGHHNLLDNVEAMKPITLENFYKKSVFSRKKLVEVVFSVDTPGCLPGESLSFILYVKNIKCIPLQTSIQLVRQIKYDASGKRDSPKRRFAILAAKEKEDFEPQPEMTWVDSLFVGDILEPSFSAHNMYNVTYCIQYKVKILDHGTVKGEAQVFIGTTRDPAHILMTKANGLDVPFQGLRRRGSASSAHSVRSHNSATTTYSLPPAYSQLSSRIPSMETLPPSYDEAELFENTLDGIRIEVPTLLSPTGEQEAEEAGTEEDVEINESNSN